MLPTSYPLKTIATTGATWTQSLRGLGEHILLSRVVSLVRSDVEQGGRFSEGGALVLDSMRPSPRVVDSLLFLGSGSVLCKRGHEWSVATSHWFR